MWGCCSCLPGSFEEQISFHIDRSLQNSCLSDTDSSQTAVTAITSPCTAATALSAATYATIQHHFEQSLTMPPPSSFGYDQNDSCLMTIRSACCRHPHYVSTVIGLTVLLAVMGLLMIQEEQIFVKSERNHSAKGLKSDLGKQSSDSRVYLVSPQFRHLQKYYEAIIKLQAERLNREWLLWIQRQEVTMRRQLLKYTARFKHELVRFIWRL